MSELVWYVYHQQQQLGPFESSQITQLLDTKMIAQDAYVFKVGWKDWRPIEETYNELGIDSKQETDKSSSLKRRLGAPRATISGRVIIHNNGQLIIGSGINISATGIFIETTDKIFKLGETLKLTCKVDGFPKQFNTEVEVIRVDSDKEAPTGYGLKFVGLDPNISDEIQKLVNEQNTHKESNLSMTS